MGRQEIRDFVGAALALESLRANEELVQRTRREAIRAEERKREVVRLDLERAAVAHDAENQRNVRGDRREVAPYNAGERRNAERLEKLPRPVPVHDVAELVTEHAEHAFVIAGELDELVENDR